jgi:hypothetical protein
MDAAAAMGKAESGSLRKNGSTNVVAGLRVFAIQGLATGDREGRLCDCFTLNPGEPPQEKISHDD